MSHSHGSPEQRAGARYRQRLLWAFFLVLIFFFVELIGGILTNSLVLISDAGHMFTDVIGLGLAIAAIQLASNQNRNRQRTFGLYRLEILAALANVILLTAVALYILYEAFERLREPPEIPGVEMFVIASLGLIVNIIAFFLLRSGASESLNLEGAYLEVMADLLGSVAAIVAALVIVTTGWELIDPIFGAAIGFFVLPRAFRLGRQTVRVLIQAAPPEIDVEAVESDLARIEGVTAVHDLHLWTLTSEMEVASAHIIIADGVEPFEVLAQANTMLHDRYGVTHPTLQIEPAGFQSREVEW